MWEKDPLSFFNVSECQQKNYISGIFWVFKSKSQINHVTTYIALFLFDSNNYFFICLVPYIHICLFYFFILCFYFHLFDTLLTMRNFTTYNVWFDFITSVSELMSNLELNNPKLTLIPLESLFCVFKMLKWSLMTSWGKILYAWLELRGNFGWFLQKCIFLIFSYAFNTMNLRCANNLNSHSFTILDKNYDI